MTDASLREAERNFILYPSYNAAQSLWLLRQRAGLPIWQIPVLPRPVPGDADEDMAVELFHYSGAEGPVTPPNLNRVLRHGYFQPIFPHDFYGQIAAIEANILKKIRKGVYDYHQVEKLWMYLVDTVAKAHNLCNFGRVTLRGISPATRLATARLLATDFERKVAEHATNNRAFCRYCNAPIHLTGLTGKIWVDETEGDACHERRGRDRRHGI